jgi:hypothetical protein
LRRDLAIVRLHTSKVPLAALADELRLRRQRGVATRVQELDWQRTRRLSPGGV